MSSTVDWAVAAIDTELRRLAEKERGAHPAVAEGIRAKMDELLEERAKLHPPPPEETA